MIIFNDDFECERDTHGWKLHVWRDGTDKNGEPIRTSSTLYYSSLQHVVESVMDMTGGKCETVQEWGDACAKLFDAINKLELSK